MAISIQKKSKGKMYACFAFFPDGSVKRWKYVRDLASFAQFLNKSHSSWKYFNVYDKGTKGYLKRFYPGNAVPKVLTLVLVFGLSLLTQEFTFGSTFKTFALLEKPNLENTTFSKTTFNNGFNNPATILTLKPSVPGGRL